VSRLPAPYPSIFLLNKRDFPLLCVLIFIKMQKLQVQGYENQNEKSKTKIYEKFSSDCDIRVAFCCFALSITRANSDMKLTF
jgi:hypothetical protein